jgi:hypothetical protein
MSECAHVYAALEDMDQRWQKAIKERDALAVELAAESARLTGQIQREVGLLAIIATLQAKMVALTADLADAQLIARESVNNLIAANFARTEMAERVAVLETALRYWLPELNEIDVAAEEYDRWAHDLALIEGTAVAPKPETKVNKAADGLPNIPDEPKGAKIDGA